MNAKIFAQELDKIVETAREQIVELVQKAQKEDGLEWDTRESISFVEDTGWQNKADSLAEIAGWIYDRLNGKTRLDKKSVTKKLRKALGYTYP
jgi:hypothetical protein